MSLVPDGPKVSVITPTWQRHDELIGRCVPSVLAQTYPNIEHIIVSDGPDPTLADLLPDDGRIQLWELDEHDNTARWGHWARLAGIAEASGPLLAYLDDDNAYRPTHIERLVTRLLDSGSDFAYSRTRMHVFGSEYDVGTNPPQYGQIDTSAILHRRELLKRNTWTQSLPSIDWDIVMRWMTAGATWAFDPQVTSDYYK